MTEMIPPVDDTPDVTAAEFALGLLDGEDRAAAMRRLLSDRAFAADVERWRGYLAQLFDLWPEAAVTGDVFGRTERTLDKPPATPAAAPRPGWMWPSLAGLSSLAAAGLLLVLLTQPAPGPIVPAPRPAATAPAPMLAAAIAPIAPIGQGAPVAALYDPASGGLRLTAAALADDARAQELWLIAGDGVPHSLGLLKTGAGTTLAVTAANRARLAAGAVLAVSLEPAGGSPTGLPTGPVVAKGALSQV